MSSLQLIITTAGRNALVNAENTGTLPLKIDKVVLGSGKYTPSESQTSLHQPIKTITTFGGDIVADDTIHITITDESQDQYVLGEIGLYAGSVLMGVYSQLTAILEKGASQMVLLSADIQFVSLPANSITVSNTGVSYPQATELKMGVMEIATSEEATIGADHSRSITPKTLRQEILTRLGKTETAVAASKWSASRKVTLSGDATGFVSFDGSGDVILDLSVVDNSHAHTIANVSGLQTALDGKLPLAGNAATATKLVTARTIALNGGATGTATAFDGSANISISVTGLDATKMTGTLPDACLNGTYTGINITGNAGTASAAVKLQTARTINGVSFDGSANIMAEPYVEQDLSTAAIRYLTFVDSSTAGYQRLNLDTNLSYNPSTNTLSTSITGNAGTATTATSAAKWATSRTLTLTGGATGSASFDGSGNFSLAVTVPPTGHVHGLSTISDSPYKEAADVGTTTALTVTATTTTLTNAGTLAALVLDGVTVTAGMRVLVKDQASTSQNGIYTVTNIGSTTVAWVLTRAVDADTSAETAGAVITVDQGSANGAALFTNDFKKTSTLGTTGMLWRTVVDAGNISSLHHASGVVAGSYRSVTVNAQGHVTGGANPTTLASYGITDAQAKDATLTALAGLTTAADKMPYFSATDSGAVCSLTAFARTILDDADAPTVRATIGAISASDNAASATKLQTARTINGVSFDGSANITVADSTKQPLDTTLTALAGITTAADKLIYATGSNTFSTTPLTPFARTILDDADAAAVCTTLGAVKTSDYATKSLMPNGHQRLPSGMILQWGTTASTINMDGSVTSTFSTAFPNACLVAQVTAFGSVTGSGVGPTMCIGSFTTTQIVILNDNNSGWYGMWFAVGK